MELKGSPPKLLNTTFDNNSSSSCFENLKIPNYSHDSPVSSKAMESLLRKRRSVRHYKSEPVTKEHLEKIIESASLVPTAHNWRAFKAYACTNKDAINQVHKKVTEHYTGFLEVLKHPVEGMPDAMREELFFCI